MTLTKDVIMKMAAEDVGKLLDIVGVLGHPGYRVCMCRLARKSFQQCANKYGVTKSHAQKYYEKCTRLGYDKELRRIFHFPE